MRGIWKLLFFVIGIVFIARISHASLGLPQLLIEAQKALEKNDFVEARRFLHSIQLLEKKALPKSSEGNSIASGPMPPPDFSMSIEVERKITLCETSYAQQLLSSDTWKHDLGALMSAQKLGDTLKMRRILAQWFRWANLAPEKCIDIFGLSKDSKDLRKDLYLKVFLPILQEVNPSVSNATPTDSLIADLQNLNLKSPFLESPEDYDTIISSSSNGGVSVNLNKESFGQEIVRLPLQQAIAKNDREMILELIKQESNINEKDSRTWAPLHEAAFQGNAEVTKILIEKKADVNSLTDDGWTPLAEACYMGHMEVVELLLKAGADISNKDRLGWNCFFRAIQNRQSRVAERLVQAGASVEDCDFAGMTPLHRAAESGQPDIVEFLLKKGVPPDTTDHHQRTALHYACEQGLLDIAALLLNHGADPNLQDARGATAMHLACRTGNIELVKILLERGANLAIKDQDGMNPIEAAALHGEEETVTFLKKEAGFEIPLLH
ncbi:MAG: ankyrin repeat domain-containing protein [Candidatus Riflebacteria bacterium]|nr:ankyrin repeat domain-containing protein [Candidatus Riflebacteria bacterium]